MMLFPITCAVVENTSLIVANIMIKDLMTMVKTILNDLLQVILCFPKLFDYSLLFV